jgi:hypothetical protein
VGINPQFKRLVRVAIGSGIVASSVGKEEIPADWNKEKEAFPRIAMG